MSDQKREQIDLLREELADIDRQVSDGDLDPDTAAAIKVRYESELRELESGLVRTEPSSEDPELVGVDPPTGKRWSRRALAGITLVMVAFVAVVIFAVQSLDDGDYAGAEGVVGDVVAGEGQIDLDSISNEQMEEVVAANPDIVPMRLALARRYFEAGEFDNALAHYFEILDREQHPEALSNVGWMTHLSGRPDVAVGYLEAALEREPDYLTAHWFLGNIYFSLDRFQDAIIPLTKVAGADSVPDEVRQAAVELLQQARATG